MRQTGELYVGLMSGTSLDGIDVVVVELTQPPRLRAAETFLLPAELRDQLLALCHPGANEIERLGAADRQLGLAFGKAVNTLLAAASIPHSAIRAIGSHGQTIRHRPPGPHQPYPFTLQIGDPTSIAQLTGIATIADFRRRDIAAGGHGAPLVPAFHRAVFGGVQSRVIVNIGGIANITGLFSDGGTLGFDTGPGNTLLDSWIIRHRGVAYDAGGAWASSGTIVQPLLKSLMADPYFAQPAPKSSGREYFNLAWLDSHIAGIATPIEPIDVQATLAELTAASIAAAIANLPMAAPEVFVCGGGAYNSHLMVRLEALLHPCRLASTAQLGIAPEWVEATAFAWLAKQTLAGKPGNEPTATGASNYCVLGAIYPA
jgi:anhydro-N-acetylmuramic acid kinase